MRQDQRVRKMRLLQLNPEGKTRDFINSPQQQIHTEPDIKCGFSVLSYMVSHTGINKEISDSTLFLEALRLIASF